MGVLLGLGGHGNGWMEVFRGGGEQDLKVGVVGLVGLVERWWAADQGARHRSCGRWWCTCACRAVSVGCWRSLRPSGGEFNDDMVPVSMDMGGGGGVGESGR